MTPEHAVARAAHRMTSAEAGELLTLQLAAWVSEAKANETLDIPPLHDTLADVVEQLADPDTAVWGYREGGRLLATVRTRLLSESAAYLGRLGVVPDHKGRGLGSAMLDLAEGRLPASVSRIELITGFRSVANHRFYERRGYRIEVRDPVLGIARMAKSR